MIRQLHIQNFRCLRDVKLRLEPLTVLVGANASGKSSVLAALSGPFNSLDSWQRDIGFRTSISGALSNGDEWEFVRDSGSTNFSRVGGQNPTAQLLQLDLNQLRAPNMLAEARALNPNGFGLANAFATLKRSAQEALAREFCNLVPMFRDVHASPSQNGSHRIRFEDRWREGLWHEPQQVSDGSMLLLAYLLLPHQSPSPDVIGIEEPERGLHPYLMGQLVEALRKLSLGELGPRPVQILLATHSAELLEHVRPEEVRFLSRSKDTGETLIEEAPTNTPQWQRAFREYGDSLGQLWLSGGLGGVPSGA